MKSKISAFMDGELHPGESPEPFAALREHGEARDAWRTYHLISDAMRDTRLLSGGFSARVAAKLAEEPTVIAPSLAGQRPRPSVWALAAAASLAVVFVGGIAYVMQQGTDAPPEVAAVQPPQTPAKEVAQVAPPDTANDYLLAHQGYSPRITLQGMAPYVRMVSGEARAGKR